MSVVLKTCLKLNYNVNLIDLSVKVVKFVTEIKLSRRNTSTLDFSWSSLDDNLW